MKVHKDIGDIETYAIIGAAMEVHRELGNGFLEPVYQEALAIELTLKEIPFEREAKIPIKYKEHQLEPVYKPDYICFHTVLVELKALSEMGGREEAQVIHYLKATGLHRALLINFGKPSLEYKRLVWNYED